MSHHAQSFCTKVLLLWWTDTYRHMTHRHTHRLNLAERSPGYLLGYLCTPTRDWLQVWSNTGISIYGLRCIQSFATRMSQDSILWQVPYSFSMWTYFCQVPAATAESNGTSLLLTTENSIIPLENYSLKPCCQQWFIHIVYDLKSVGALEIKFIAPIPEQIATTTMHFPKVLGELC